MPAPITCYKDIDTGHGPYLPSPALGPIPPQELPDKLNTSDPKTRPFACSGNVLAGTKGVHRQGDIRIFHLSGSIPPTAEPTPAYAGGLTPWLKSGSLTVKANGRGVGRIGDPVVCGSTILTGNITVIVGD